MPKDWLVYWRNDQIQAAAYDRLLDHAASEQFIGVKPGDALWIAGEGKNSKLVTVGPLRVAEILNQKAAENRLQQKLWKAKYHAVSKPGEETVAREVSLDSIIGDLRFVSERNPKLDPQKPFGQQLQRIRHLAQPSAELLGRLWASKVANATSDFEGVQARLDALSDLDQEVTVVQRREQTLLRDFLFGSSEVGTCAICGSLLPVTLLVAAHIKPRSECTDSERRDFANNVVPICLLGCDALFERGLVVAKAGRLKVRIRARDDSRLKALCHHLNGRRISAWKPGRIPFFRWHARADHGLY